MKHFIFPMNLQLFAEGGAPSGDGGGEGTGVTAQAAAVQSKGVKNNPLANVIYGKQPQEKASAAEVQKVTETKPETTPDLDAEFEELIKGKFKDQYNKRTQDTIRQRLKGAKETEERLTAMNPLMDMLSTRYGVKADDTEGLIKALQADDAFLEDAAAKEDMTPKQYREFLQLKGENARLKNESEERLKREQRDQQYAVWEQQAEQAKALYPNLDLNVESQNPQFRQLLFAGIDVGTAYMAIHKDDVMAGAMQYAANDVKQKLANNVAAGNRRPPENGASGQSAAIIKSDPSKWTRADREEAKRRAARGEKIYL